MQLDAVHADMESFAAADSVDALTALCRDKARALGFDSFVYALRVPTDFADARLIMIDGYPPGWVSHYMGGAFYDIDPVMKYCADHVIPLQWSDIAAAPGDTGHRVMNEAAAFGLRAGISMPIHSPQGEFGVLSFALDAASPHASDVTRHALPRIQLLAAYLHEAVRRVSGRGQGVQGRTLTERERECLRWAADGKTSSEIAQILNMAESTANFHLRNAMLKLDVSNRQHAVAKAALQGLIHPRPF